MPEFQVWLFYDNFDFCLWLDLPSVLESVVEAGQMCFVMATLVDQTMAWR